jgi:hypothetical protein
MSTAPKKTSNRINPSIKKDVIHPSDYLHFSLSFSCEECSHFNPETEACTIGYVSAHHRKAEQTRQYLLSGSMALCRFHEID